MTLEQALSIGYGLMAVGLLIGMLAVFGRARRKRKLPWKWCSCCGNHTKVTPCANCGSLDLRKFDHHYRSP